MRSKSREQMLGDELQIPIKRELKTFLNFFYYWVTFEHLRRLQIGS